MTLTGKLSHGRWFEGITENTKEYADRLKKKSKNNNRV